MTNALLPEIETTRWYAEKVQRYGYDHRGLGFRSRFAQERRFEALARLGDFDGRRILDVGCGFGDFLPFLEKRGIRPVYTGIDICEPMVRHCRERFPASAARFVVSDVLQFEPDGTFDYVVASIHTLFGMPEEKMTARVCRALAHPAVTMLGHSTGRLLLRRGPSRHRGGLQR